MLMLGLGSMAIDWMRDDRFLPFGDVERPLSSFLLVDAAAFSLLTLGFLGAAGFLPVRLVGLTGRSSGRSEGIRNVTPLGAISPQGCCPSSCWRGVLHAKKRGPPASGVCEGTKRVALLSDVSHLLDV